MGNPSGLNGYRVTDKRASSEDEMDYNQRSVLGCSSHTIFNRSGGIKLVNPTQITNNLKFAPTGFMDNCK